MFKVKLFLFSLIFTSFCHSMTSLKKLAPLSRTLIARLSAYSKPVNLTSRRTISEFPFGFGFNNICDKINPELNKPKPILAETLNEPISAHVTGSKAEDLAAQDAPSINADNCGFTALHLATILGDADLVKTLLANGELVDAKDSHGETVLFVAIQSATNPLIGTHVANLLIRQGADVNARGINNSTPLIEAAKVGNLTLVRDILKAGADIDAQDNDGQTALHNALQQDYSKLFGGDKFEGRQQMLRIVQELLQAGINPNLQTVDGNTAAHFAAVQNNMELIALLEEAGADFRNMRNVEGLTALELMAMEA